MAPYTMTITVDNKTGFEVRYTGISTLGSVDGYTNQNGSDIPASSTGTVTVTKGGGTDGMFTLVVFEVLGTKFGLWCQMSARAGSKVSVRMTKFVGYSPPRVSSLRIFPFEKETREQVNVVKHEGNTSLDEIDARYGGKGGAVWYFYMHHGTDDLRGGEMVDDVVSGDEKYTVTIKLETTKMEHPNSECRVIVYASKKE